jgi:ATP-dependent RNA/DNA helicase IGHMBP2
MLAWQCLFSPIETRSHQPSHRTSRAADVDRRNFATEHLRLLRLEREAEIAEAERLLHTRSDAELQARGTTLLRLEVVDLEPGFGGRLHAILRPSRGNGLPAHRFGPGDVISVRQHRDERPLCTGVFVRARGDQITVALDDEDADLPPLVRLDQIATDVTFRRMEGALRELTRDKKGEEARYLDVLFGEREPVFAPAPPTEAIRWFDPNLDPTQREAIAHALRAEHVALIHGPPGTGKTTAVVELIRQCVAQGERILACAPSNVAVDNLAERLLRAGLRIVRLGHPARVQATVRDVSLASLVAESPEQKLLRDIKREVEQGLRQVHRASSRQDRFAARNNVRALRGELRQLEGAITKGLVDGAEVVLATTTGAANDVLFERPFHRVVIDEAAQALEAACWIALPRGARCVLAGDHRQLPPTIQSAAAAHGGLARTLFERLMESPVGGQLGRLLRVQYRMHHKIMGWSSQHLYDSQLEAAPAVQHHLLSDLPDVVASEWTTEPLCFVDTAGCGHDESTGDDEGSKRNDGEAGLVVRIVLALREANVPANAIAVVTPYNAQVQLLRDRLSGEPEIEIGTVDGLQGREKEAVVVSLVRSNEQGEVGFLAELRRLNVALTRARRHLTVIGDSATLARDSGLRGMVDYLQAHAHYRTAFELN